MTDEVPSTPARGTPEGHTKEAPRLDELGEPGSPGHGMTPAAGATDQHASADEHGHDEPRLGPVDWAAWGYAAVGIAAGLLVILALWVAIG